MQLVTNTTLVRNRVRLAGALHFAALVVFGIGLLVSLQPQAWFYSYFAIVVGLLLYQVAQTNLRRWGPRHRQEGLLHHSLRGLDDRYALVAFPASSLPDYLLVGPSGISVLVARPQRGAIVCRADKWSMGDGGGSLLRLLRAPLGNPTSDARAGVELVKHYLGDKRDDGENQPVEAVVVFTHPEARLRIDGCSYPVTTAKELRHYLRRTKGSLSQAQVAQLREELTRFRVKR